MPCYLLLKSSEEHSANVVNSVSLDAEGTAGHLHAWPALHHPGV